MRSRLALLLVLALAFLAVPGCGDESSSGTEKPGDGGAGKSCSGGDGKS